MFGQAGNASFTGFNNATQTSPFGQSAFGKPIATTSFGSAATPVFGSSNTSLFSSKPAGSTTGGLFGNTTTPPAFTQPSFGGFGTTNTNTNLFGSPQQNPSTSLFGTNATTSAFGQSNKSAGFSFGTTTGANLFGQPQQPTQQTTPFGQTNTTANTNLFSTAPGFGNTNTATTSVIGTVVKFTPVITTDSMSKNGISHSISARHCCIASMKEYESKSYEELRFEDYSVGRKGPSTGIFGTAAQSSPFGNTGAGTSTAITGFGGMSGGFGTTTQSGSSGPFGKQMTSFGTPSTTTTNSFAFNSTPSTNLFGTNTQAKPFGTAPTPLFPTSNTNQTAGTSFGSINPAQNTGFGSTFGSTQPNQNIGLFNQNKSAFNVPPTSSSTSFTSFGQAPASNTGATLFGAKSTGTAGFGTAPTFGSTTTSTFGTTTGFTPGQNSGTSLFNTCFKPAGQTSGFSFGSNAAPSTGLGTNTGLTLGSGSTLFGQQKPGGLFGAPGTNTTFNTTASFGSSTFGTNSNMGTGMGMSLLGPGSANNQMKSTGTVPVHQQILALVSAPFGDSPLLKNLLPASGKAEELLKPSNAPSKILNGPQYKVTADNKSPKIKAKVVTPAQLSKKSMFEGLDEEDPLSEAFQPRPNAKRLVLRPKSISNSIILSPSENSQPVGKNAQSPGKEEEKTNGMNSYVENTSIEAVDKENHIHENNRQSGNDRRSSTSWLKTSLPRNSTTKHSNEESEGQRSPFSAANGSTDEVVNNTITELRPYANTSPSNHIHSEVNNSGDASLKNNSLADKSCVDTSAQNTDSSQELDDSSFWAQQNSQWKMNAAKVTLKRAGYYTIPPLEKLEEYVNGETCIVPHFTVGRKGYGNVYFSDSFDIYGLNLDEIVHFRLKEVIIYPDDEKKPPVGQGLNRKAQVTLDRVWPHDKSLHKPITDPHRLTAMDYEEKLRRVSAKHDTRFLEYRPETGSWVFKVDHFSKYGLSDSDEDDSNNASLVTDPKRLKLSEAGQQKSATNLEQSKVPNKKVAAIVNGTTNDSKIGGADYSDLLGSVAAKVKFHREVGRALPASPTEENACLRGTDSHKLQLMKANFFDGSDEEMSDVYERDLDRALFLPEQKNSIRYVLDSTQKLDEDQDYGTLYNPTLRSNLTIYRMPSFAYEEPILSKADAKSKRAMEIIGSKLPIYEKSFPDPIIVPITTILKWQSEVIPLYKSIIYKLESRCIADTGIQMGRMFKPSWGPGLTLLTLSTKKQAAEVHLCSPFERIWSYMYGRLPEDRTSAAVVQRIQILGGDWSNAECSQTFEKSIEGHLKIQLSHCIMDQEGDCPLFNVDTDIHKARMALHAHCNLAEECAESWMDQSASDSFATYVANVWKLCVALWGTLPEINVCPEDSADHHIVIARREAIGEWLKNVIRLTLDWDVTNMTYEEQIMRLLFAFKLEEACQNAQKVGDHCLALLMAQLCSGMPTKALINQQMALWQDSGADENISKDRLKIYALLAGEPLVSSKQGPINVCQGLDWKRALAVHLWYFSSPVASIRDALELYETSFDPSKTTDVYATSPTPEYKGGDYELELNNGKPIYDLCFHLLKLYCTGNHALGELLNPAAHTADPLDYRLSWLMQQVLLALGYSHLSEHVAALTHVNFATQLEAHGLWHWAVFVMLHLKGDARKRKTGVMNLLERHVEIDDDDIPDYEQEQFSKEEQEKLSKRKQEQCVREEREKFLKEELGIPSIWIHQAKAVKSYVTKRYDKAASYFIQAEQWNTAHEIIIEHLAADAIINENYKYLRDLLKPLNPPEFSGTISGWAHQGQLLLEYMDITMDIESLLRGADPRGISYKLELLKPRLTCLCLKINQFPCPTAKHRLCQAEIAKRTLHLARSLLQSNENKSNVILQLVSQLPLPEDYAQQELRPIINMRVNEIISQTV
ncbi:nuclear pore complex protein Nup98-Nup96 isoform X4 [Hylaeus volcanicus]|uniref:nuclear pore complex protein Nup98-Nup96 isoform X4 n=1 Tax=Hylaeus volcanicus TaxID=313075 RepID=UPI0023B7CC49|nr:nuclear pore complex protein Nup98-Nup96 isoform X4 [Hylaeus volcanicus]